MPAADGKRYTVDLVGVPLLKGLIYDFTQRKHLRPEDYYILREAFWDEFMQAFRRDDWRAMAQWGELVHRVDGVCQSVTGKPVPRRPSLGSPSVGPGA